MARTAASLNERQYQAWTDRTRARRLRWWQEARFGMFVHWGLYAQLGRHEWVMNRERIPVCEYEKLADTWKPRPRAAREWAALARRAGMRYMVLTTKHHEGFLLWDSAMSDYNAAARGPGRDLVREYVDAAREFGLRVGFYYSLMDWHHPDGARCLYDRAARRRFLDYTQGCVRELCSNYGKIDILWYDVSWPLRSPREWESVRMNAMVRRLQPGILINNRAQLPEDFGTPEEHIQAEAGGRAWEACMTFNGSWGWQPTPPEDWRSTRSVLDMLRTCTAGQGNLLLNIGPKPDGSVPEEAVERLTAVGRWIKRYGGAMYGRVDRVENMDWMPTGNWSRRGSTLYFWCTRWPGRELAIGGLSEPLIRARLYPAGKPLPFEQAGDRLVIRGLPEMCPDPVAGVALVELVFRRPPRQRLGAGCVLPEIRTIRPSPWRSPGITVWQMSALQPRRGTVAEARNVRLAHKLGWRTLQAREDFVSVHEAYGTGDGLVYLGNRFQVDEAGEWILRLGHDAALRVFVDGRPVFIETKRVNPAPLDRSRIPVRLAKGRHEIVVALDTDHGMGWGFYACFEVPRSARRPGVLPRFPLRVGPGKNKV
jgi:alpha-L-fucosidase